MEGWIKLHRQIKDHWLWRSDNRFKWWIDILLTVNHSDSKVLIKGTLIDCKRGQSIRSLESWAKDWNVSKCAVRDFFKLLTSDQMLHTESLQFTTRITVCKYEDYQTELHIEKTQKKRKGNATETLSIPKQEYKEEREINTNVFIYSEFYDNEIKLSENNPDYIKFVKFIYGGNDIEKRLNRVLGLKDQLTYAQFEKILTKSIEKNKKLRNMLLDLENNVAYTKGRSNLYSIFNSWLNRDAK